MYKDYICLNSWVYKDVICLYSWVYKDVICFNSWVYKNIIFLNSWKYKDVICLNSWVDKDVICLNSWVYNDVICFNSWVYKNIICLNSWVYNILSVMTAECTRMKIYLRVFKRLICHIDLYACILLLEYIHVLLPIMELCKEILFLLESHSRMYNVLKSRGTSLDII